MADYRKAVVECRAPSQEKQPDCDHYERESKWSLKCTWRFLDYCMYAPDKKLHSKRVGE